MSMDAQSHFLATSQVLKEVHDVEDVHEYNMNDMNRIS